MQIWIWWQKVDISNSTFSFLCQTCIKNTFFDKENKLWPWSLGENYTWLMWKILNGQSKRLISKPKVWTPATFVYFHPPLYIKPDDETALIYWPLFIKFYFLLMPRAHWIILSPKASSLGGTRLACRSIACQECFWQGGLQILVLSVPLKLPGGERSKRL